MAVSSTAMTWGGWVIGYDRWCAFRGVLGAIDSVFL